MSEELIKSAYLSSNGEVLGDDFGPYERFTLGETNLQELKKHGIIQGFSSSVSFQCQEFELGNISQCKPDALVTTRTRKGREVLLVIEFKTPSNLSSTKDVLSAQEQCICYAQAVSAPLGYVTDGQRRFWIDITKSVETNTPVLIDSNSQLDPVALELVLRGDDVIRDPGDLAETVWQTIWHATKAEPKDCLLTFVEVFIYKFISDNVSPSLFPRDYTVESLLVDPDDFKFAKGMTQIEYYAQTVRPKIKEVFPEHTTVTDPVIERVYGFKTITSRTSVIDGFAFLATGQAGIDVYNETFLDILWLFQDFGPLTRINPEFKSRLYEKFLKRSIKQAKLGQFFTPRNLIRAMVRMGDLGSLSNGAVVVDPACGVGGFLLEPLLHDHALAGNYELTRSGYDRKVHVFGSDVDHSTHVLGKANMLLHLVEEVRRPDADLVALNQLMARTFLLLDANKHLGSLTHVIKGEVDVVLTNPPYVTQGSAIYKKEIAKDGDLQEFYDRSGLGLESLFMRYIIEALKPGGRAFVIVPQGFLARTETTAKGYLLEECILRGIISIPRNTFYATPQKTYILCLHKRSEGQTNVQTDPVFCYLVGEVGETRDAERLPCRNDLEDAADQYLLFRGNPKLYSSDNSRVKVIPAASLGAGDRWDIHRFWSETELAELGHEDMPVPREDFLEEVLSNLQAAEEETEHVLALIRDLESGPTTNVQMSDPDLVTVERGVRVTRAMARDHPGSIPVYSGSKDVSRPLGTVSEDWARAEGIPVQEYPTLTVNANGLVGAVFYRTGKCIIHDDVNIVRLHGEFTRLAADIEGPKDTASVQRLQDLLKQLVARISDTDRAHLAAILPSDSLAEFVDNLHQYLAQDYKKVLSVLRDWRFSMLMEKYRILDPLLVPEYFRWALREAIVKERFEYGAKLYSSRLKELAVKLPVDDKGDFDLQRQRELAEAQERLESLRKHIRDMGAWAEDAKLQRSH